MMMISPETPDSDREDMLKAIGYYDPLPFKYIKWMSRLLQGDMGFSIIYSEQVSSVIWRNMKNTLILSLTSLFISTILAITLGIISAIKQYSFFDYTATVFSFLGLSIPSFFFALILIKFLAFQWGLFPISGMYDPGSTSRSFGELIHHMILPVIVLSLLHVSSLMRYTRSSMLEVIHNDYVRTARAKGVSEHRVIFKHALRNALIPVATLLSLSLGGLFSGAVLTEQVFDWPGMGTLMYKSIAFRDYPVIMGCSMFFAVMIVLANLVADIVYTLIDPRIRYD